MSDSFQRRMRRRARLSAYARIGFVIFGVIALGGTSALRLARGCAASPPAEVAPDRRP